MPLVWNLIKWLFLLWVLIYVCTFSCSCFMQFSPFSHTIIPHLYIFTPIFIVLPNSLGLVLFVCNWFDKKIKFILSYLILAILIVTWGPSAQVTLYDVVQLCHHWFRWWLLACSIPSHYITPWHLIINLTIGNKLREKLDLKYSTFQSTKCKWKYWPFCSGVNVLWLHIEGLL